VCEGTKPSSINARIRVTYRGDDSRNTGGDDPLDTRWSSAVMSTGFEGHVQGGSSRSAACILDGDHLGM
jgi:hypothetical protein